MCCNDVPLHSQSDVACVWYSPQTSHYEYPRFMRENIKTPFIAKQSAKGSCSCQKNETEPCFAFVLHFETSSTQRRWKLAIDWRRNENAELKTSVFAMEANWQKKKKKKKIKNKKTGLSLSSQLVFLCFSSFADRVTFRIEHGVIVCVQGISLQLCVGLSSKLGSLSQNADSDLIQSRHGKTVYDVRRAGSSARSRKFCRYDFVSSTFPEFTTLFGSRFLSA